MGTHITFVKSLTLDCWTDELAESLSLCQDVNVNLEYHVVEGFKKPIVDSINSVCKEFVTAKYIDKLFSKSTNKGMQPRSAIYDTQGGRQMMMTHSKSVGMQETHGILNINLKRATDLPKLDTFSDSDPYVVFECGEFQRQKSSAIQDDNNPVWEEMIRLTVNELVPIKITLYDEDDLSKDDVMGEIIWNWYDDLSTTDRYFFKKEIDCSCCRKNRKKTAFLELEVTYTKLS